MAKATGETKASRIRFRILALIFVNVVINYMDRSNISVAATSISMTCT
jgi:ACS family D-galactonate transporter-like MFS transporter